jgi:Family of unknown function (DUF6496)
MISPRAGWFEPAGIRVCRSSKEVLPMATRSTATRKKSTGARKKSTGTRKKSTGARKKSTAPRKKSTAPRKKSTGRKKSSRKKSSRKYSPAASETVHKEMREYKKGTARSGPGGKGGKVKSRKQAIAIGLSEARKQGKKVPARRGGRKKK